MEGSKKRTELAQDRHWRQRKISDGHLASSRLDVIHIKKIAAIAKWTENSHENFTTGCYF